MDPVDTRFNRRVRLTNEELLAGKCFPDDMPKPSELGEDPRIKSPDVVLEKNGPSAIAAQFNNKRVNELEQQMKEMQLRHNSEMEQWKEYAHRVTLWQYEVAKVIEKLKSQALKNS